MTLKELKKMIAEEYKYWKAEQVGDMGMPDMMVEPDMPGVDVGPDDIDMEAGDNPEDTLRQIFDMLKAYFEGGEEPAEDEAEEEPAEDEAEEEPAEDEAEEEDEEEDEEVAETKKAKNESLRAKRKAKRLKESKIRRQVLNKANSNKVLIERFQKLANIKK